MEYLRVALSALCSIIVLFLLAKIMGSRQISQLSFFDYINGITIGSIAAEFALCGGKDFLPPLIAMTVYALAAALISIATNKSNILPRKCTRRCEDSGLPQAQLILSATTFQMQGRTPKSP
ncbi:MAG: hypothetical protein RSG78_05260, partial [Oscillospiraceae bacterium]